MKRDKNLTNKLIKCSVNLTDQKQHLLVGFIWPPGREIFCYVTVFLSLRCFTSRLPYTETQSSRGALQQFLGFSLSPILAGCQGEFDSHVFNDR